MNPRFLLYILSISILAACAGKKQQSNFNIIFFGYDSLACYYGSSDRMIDLKNGRLSDSAFTNGLLAALATDAHVDSILLKPGTGGSVLTDCTNMDTLLERNGFINKKITYLDEKEQRFFNTGSALTMMKEWQEEGPLKLFLPRESEHIRPVQAHDLVVLLINDEEAYVYQGKNIGDGKKSTIKELIALLKQKRNDDLFIYLKPGKSGTYKSTINALDAVAAAKVVNYSMEEPTVEEEAFVKRLQSTQ